jgi:hypothetical protein
MGRAVQRMGVEMQSTLADQRHELLTGFDRTQISFDGAINKVAANDVETLKLIVGRFEVVDDRIGEVDQGRDAVPGDGCRVQLGAPGHRSVLIQEILE